MKAVSRHPDDFAGPNRPSPESDKEVGVILSLQTSFERLTPAERTRILVWLNDRYASD